MSLGVTLLNLLGIDNAEGLFGNDLLQHPVGITPVEHNYHVGLVTDVGLTVLHRGGARSSWRHAEAGLVQADIDELAARRAALFFGGAHRWFYGSAEPSAVQERSAAQ